MAGTKKTAADSTEVKKKFCTNCGKQLNEGEVCDCTATKEVKEEKVEKEAPVAVSVNGDVLMESTKNIFKDVLDMIKKPATTLRKKLKTADTKNAMILIAIIAVSFGVYTLISFKTLLTAITSTINISGGRSLASALSQSINIPYFKIFLYCTLISFALAFIPILITLIIGKFTRSEDFDFKKSATLYAYSMAPKIYANLLLALLSLLNISFLTIVGSVVAAFFTTSCMITYIKGFVDNTSISDDRKAYAITGTAIVWAVAAVLVLGLFVGSMISDLAKDVTSSANAKSTINSIFK